MKIAIQAADLDSPRIDGTRVYILNLLRYFGKLDQSSQFLIYHKKEFNPSLTPPDFPNYKIIKKQLPHLWTQTRFAASLWKDYPDVLWMPMHNVPLMRKGELKTVVTIHDLAFKYFPETFTKKDLFKINLLTWLAVNQADKIITVSESSKRDILKFYPKVKEENIKVIYHGFDREVFDVRYSEQEIERVLLKYGVLSESQKSNVKSQNCKSKIKSLRYLLYLGAIQPRKNLELLVRAFGILKSISCRAELISASKSRNNEIPKQVQDDKISNLKLVLAGERAWLSDGVFKEIEKSPYKKDIIVIGQVDHNDIGKLYQGTAAFVFPSLYEGFGIPILEALASRVPVICSQNSSLPEVGGEAATYFDGKNSQDLADKIKEILEDQNLRENMIEKGLEQVKKFSWEKCARETLEYIKS